jgi:O-antigen/teichoic acid export membrane protein
MATLIAVGLIVVSPLAELWIKDRLIGGTELRTLVILFAAFLATAWPGALYSGALSGLEKQVPLNIITAAAATVRNGGAVLVLWLISPTLQALLVWQAVTNLVATIVLRIALKRQLAPAVEKPKFQIALLQASARYATGVTGILVMLTALSQMDKLLLVRFVPLEVLGYYSLASTVALALTYFTGPVTTVWFPRMVKAYQAGEIGELSRLYHTGCQMIALLVVPTGAILALFSAEVLGFWTRDASIASQTAPLLSALAIAATLNMMVSLSYSMQAGAGWNRLVFYIHAVSVVAMAFSLMVVVPVWGPLGAAICWIVLYLTHLIVGPSLMHRRLLVGELGIWSLQDVLVPTLSGICTVIIGRTLMPVSAPSAVILCWIGFFWLSAIVVQLTFSNRLRGSVTRQLSWACRTS